MKEDIKNVLHEELTTKMHSEFSVSKDVEQKLRAGCVWNTHCDENSSREEIEHWAKFFSISYEVAMQWRDYWLEMSRK